MGWGLIAIVAGVVGFLWSGDARWLIVCAPGVMMIRWAR